MHAGEPNTQDPTSSKVDGGCAYNLVGRELGRSLTDLAYQSHFAVT
jgi:hypothetical protein